MIPYKVLAEVAVKKLSDEELLDYTKKSLYAAMQHIPYFLWQAMDVDPTNAGAIFAYIEKVVSTMTPEAIKSYAFALFIQDFTDNEEIYKTYVARFEQFIKHFKVKFEVEYSTCIYLSDPDDFDNAVANIDVPENDTCVLDRHSFKVLDTRRLL
jgi:hypothetical protein